MGNASSQSVPPPEELDEWLVTPIRKPSGLDPAKEQRRAEKMARKQRKQEKKARKDQELANGQHSQNDQLHSTAEGRNGASQDDEAESSQVIDPSVDPRLQAAQATAVTADNEQMAYASSLPNPYMTETVPESSMPLPQASNVHQRTAQEIADEAQMDIDAQASGAIEQENICQHVFDDQLPTPESSRRTQMGSKAKGKGRPKKPKQTEAMDANPILGDDAQTAAALQAETAQGLSGDLSQQSLQTPQAPPRSRKRKRGLADGDDQAEKRARSSNINSSGFPTSGPFDKGEEEQIDSFVTRFREDNHVSPVEMNNIIQDRNRARDLMGQSFWKEAYQCLPNRNAKAMQRHLRRKYHNYASRGKWTDKEDEELDEAYSATPNKWTAIGDRLQRMPEDCRDRWRNYVSCGDSRRMAVWTEGEEMKLSEAVHEAMHDIHEGAKRDAKERKIAFREDQDWEALINFNVVSEKMQHTRSRLQCLTHWKKIKARSAREEAGETVDRRRKSGSRRDNWRSGTAYANYNHMTPGDKYTILRGILDSDTYNEERIPWRLISQRVGDSPWTTADRKAAWERMKYLIEPQDTLMDTVRALMDYLEKNHAHQLDDFYEGPRPKRKKGRKKGGKNRKTIEREMGEQQNGMNDDNAGAEMPPDAVGVAPMAQMVATPEKKGGRAKGKGKGKGKRSAAEMSTQPDDVMDRHRPEVDPALVDDGSGGVQGDLAANLQAYNDGVGNGNDGDREEDEHLLPANRAAEYAEDEQEMQEMQETQQAAADVNSSPVPQRVPALRNIQGKGRRGRSAALANGAGEE